MSWWTPARLPTLISEEAIWFFHPRKEPFNFLNIRSVCPRVVVSALGGGGGKTTVALGLVAAWRESRLQVAPFKKGPDFIDVGWLAAAAGHPCFNLDPYLMGPDLVRYSFIQNTSQASIAVIEGNRGLYDGVDADGSYSTAELSKALSAPVLLVVDTTKMTRTAAAVVLGCQKLDEQVRIGGVILNRVGRSRQEGVIRRAVEQYCGIPVVGAIPRMKMPVFPERHMGLLPADEHPTVERVIREHARLGREHLDLGAIRDMARSAPEISAGRPGAVASPSGTGLRVGVVRDSAFQFYYPENISMLTDAGCDVVMLSALTDQEIPALDALYIGGGFPETHAPLLSKNESFRESLRRGAASGLPIYAECGGLMYLGESLRLDGEDYPMAGVLPIALEMSQKPKGHGYTDILVDGENPFFPPGTRLKGHEFHYSSIRTETAGRLRTAFSLARGTGVWDHRDGIVQGNVFASYTHLHALASPEWVQGMVSAARSFRDSREA